ncbi:ATP-binding protein [Belliella aquatica]|uniref:AAA+ ATPase domain-containing protein n=1 Tax=Belliella aquatica TaxID=1323734 RepID=A0ABQ1MBK0_9BACT|nr:ATP-binding protein [Belliella aquatica]MCH7406320.1 ATP-binding protein [Belliella aquatica]GGC37836.1 hypothetical protein GCM10010993_15920 [Belliella aquatica]
MAIKEINELFVQPIVEDLKWLKAVIDWRMRTYFDDSSVSLDLPEPPELEGNDSPFYRFLLENQLGRTERIVLLMSLAPLLYPQIFDCFFIQNKSIGRQFSEFGGLESKSGTGFKPTLETVHFVLHGKDIMRRVDLFNIFSNSHFLVKNQYLLMQEQHAFHSFWSNPLTINEDFFYHLVSGVAVKPRFSADFPAKELNSPIEIDELILSSHLKDELANILTWMQHREEIKSNSLLSKSFKKGYKALFYGPPGTGKSLTAAVLGSQSACPVYRVDLSRIVSKYIGETEKNLSNLFDRAENQHWILFFDEADSLFSKRTEINDSKDKYANQGTSYLLQRLEEFDGLVILASNLKPNIDRAFLRRFQSVMYFSLPSYEDRVKMWNNALKSITFAKDLDVHTLAEKYEVSGAAINNATQFAWLIAKKHLRNEVLKIDLEAGLLREMAKEGKSVK